LLRRLLEVRHVVRLHDIGTINMELYGGYGVWSAMLLSPRGTHLESGDSTAIIARVAMDIAAAIAGCADLNILHRDVTPSNILVHGQRGFLTDFNIAEVRPAMVPCTTEAYCQHPPKPTVILTSMISEASPLLIHSS